MFGCKKMFGCFYISNRSGFVYNSGHTKFYKVVQNYFSTSEGTDIKSKEEKVASSGVKLKEVMKKKAVIGVSSSLSQSLEKPIFDNPTKLADSTLKTDPVNFANPSLNRLSKESETFKSQVETYVNKSFGSKNRVDALKVVIPGSLLAAYIIYKILNAPGKEPVAITLDPVDVKSPKMKRHLPPPDILKEPKLSEEIPSEIPYLLIGGGAACYAAFLAIRSHEPKAKVLVVSKEPFTPYMRPPLSKEMFASEDAKDPNNLTYNYVYGMKRSVLFQPKEYYIGCSSVSESVNGGVAIARGWTIDKLDVMKKEATLDDGKVIKFEKCLIATGGMPRNVPAFQEASKEIKEKITVYRGISDYTQVENLFADDSSIPKTIAIVGGGVLGCELAKCLHSRGQKQGTKIMQIVRGAGILPKVLPSYLSKWATSNVINEGVQVITETEVKDVSLEHGQLRLILTNGTSMIADHVIVAIGIEPNTELARSAGLEIDKKRGGFLVNSQMMARSDVYVAGDCASFYDNNLVGRYRGEHYENAFYTGRVAGQNMIGKHTFYNSEAMSETLIWPNINYRAVGVTDSRLPTVAVYHKQNDETVDNKYKKGIVYYLKNEIIVGILMWNMHMKIPYLVNQFVKERRHQDDIMELTKLLQSSEVDEVAVNT